MHVYLSKKKKLISLLLMVGKLASLTNAYDLTLQKHKILNINLTQSAWPVTAYQMFNISFGLA